MLYNIFPSPNYLNILSRYLLVIPHSPSLPPYLPNHLPPQIHSLDTFECIQTIRGHTHWVRALCVEGDNLYSGSHNTIRILNLHTNRVHAMQGKFGVWTSLSLSLSQALFLYLSMYFYLSISLSLSLSLSFSLSLSLPPSPHR